MWGKWQSRKTVLNRVNLFRGYPLLVQHILVLQCILKVFDRCIPYYSLPVNAVEVFNIVTSPYSVLSTNVFVLSLPIMETFV